MSANINTRNAVDRGGRGKKKRRTPFHKKAFVSTHIDPAMKSAIFNSGDVGDATKYAKSMETIVTYIARSGKEHPTQL